VLGQVGEKGRLRPVTVDEVADHRRHLPRRFRQEGPVLGVARPGRQRPAVAGLETRLAGVAVARPHRPAAVVGRRVAEHVEEEAVHRVALQGLGQDPERVLAVVAAVDAGGVEPVVDGGLAVRPLEEPLGVRVEHGLLRLAEVESPDDADLPGVGLVQHRAEEVAPRGQVRARVVERDPRRVLGDDPAHVEEERVCGELRYLLDEPPSFERGVDLAHVRLDEAHGLVHPPARRRPGRRGGGGQGQGESEGKRALRHRVAPCPWRVTTTGLPS
jgi:hypothetical protein